MKFSVVFDDPLARESMLSDLKRVQGVDSWGLQTDMHRLQGWDLQVAL